MFVQQLGATEEQFIKNVHHNMEGSSSYYFTRFCEDSVIRTIVQQDNMAAMSVRLINDHFSEFSLQSIQHKERVDKLTASNITDNGIREECYNISKNMREYRKLIDDWIKFTEALIEKNLTNFWTDGLWSNNINRLADNYDELMAMVKSLRTATPKRFKNLLPADEELKKFPKESFNK